MSDLNAVMKQAMSTIPECVACGYVDLSTGMLLDISTVDSHPQEVLEILAAATSDLFQGSNVVMIEDMFKTMNKAEMMERLDRAGIPFAPINKPADLFEDEHLNAGGLLELTLSNGDKVKLPGLPIEFSGERCGLRQDLPKEGEHSRAAAEDAGYTEDEIEKMIAEGIIRIE